MCLNEYGDDKSWKSNHIKSFRLNNLTSQEMNSLDSVIKQQIVTTAVIVTKNRSIDSVGVAIRMLAEKSYAKNVWYWTNTIRGRMYNEVRIYSPNGSTDEFRIDDTYGVVFPDNSANVAAFNIDDDIFCATN
jgi:hypothetical protein